MLGRPLARAACSALTVLLAACHLQPMEAEPFSAERLRLLGEEGAVVLVEVHAPWCSTCVRQARALQALLRRSEFRALHVLRLDWDSQEDEALQLGVIVQGTLIMCRDGQVAEHVIGLTDADAIAAFIRPYMVADPN